MPVQPLKSVTAEDLHPSHAKRWTECPASVAMNATFDRGSSDIAREGSAAHKAAELILMGLATSKSILGPVFHGHVITPEMVADIESYIETATQVTKGPGVIKSGIEHKVPMFFGQTRVEGTADTWAVTPEALSVYDLKYGFILVEARENRQLMLYAIGLLNLLTEWGISWPPVVRLGIDQPRAYHTAGRSRWWQVNTAELYEWWPFFVKKGKEALGPNPEFKSGPHCLYCDGMPHCKTSRLASMAALDVSGFAHLEELPPAALASELVFLQRAFQALKLRKESLEDHVTELIQKGRHVPGFALDIGPGRRKWSASDEELKALEELTGKKLFIEKPITLDAAKALIGKDLLAKYVTSRNTGHKLVTRDETAHAEALFGKP